MKPHMAAGLLNGLAKTRIPLTAIAASVVVLAAGACSKSAPAVGPPADARAAASQSEPSDKPSGRWLIRELQVELQLEADQRVAGADEAAVSAAVQQGLIKAETIGGVGPQPGFALADQAGLWLQIAWQRLDDRGRPQPLQHAADGQLMLLVIAHAETAAAGKRQHEVAERTKRSLLPVPSSVSDWPGWLLPRVQRAAEVAAVEVLGELWARRAPEADLAAALHAPALWQVLASTREVGERRLAVHRADLEKLSRDSRREVAVIAVAALGRLGGAESVATLRHLVDHGPPEVVDAALVSLAGLKEPAARTALTEFAADGDAELSARAKELLQGAAELPETATP